MTILTKSETLIKIRSLKTRSKTMKTDVQACVIAGLYHASEHGDFSLLTRLVESVTATHATQLRKFIADHSPATWRKGKGYKKGKGDFNLAAAESILWDEYKRESAPREKPEYNRAAVIADIQAKIEKFGGIAAEHGDGELNSALATFYQLLDQLNTALAA